MNRRPSFRRDLTLVAATTAALAVGAGIGIGVYAHERLGVSSVCADDVVRERT